MFSRIVKFYQTTYVWNFKTFFTTQQKVFGYIGLNFGEKDNFIRVVVSIILSSSLFIYFCKKLCEPEMPVEKRFEILALVITDVDILLKYILFFWNKNQLWKLYNTLNNLFDYQRTLQTKIIRSWKIIEIWIYFAITAWLFTACIPFFVTLYFYFVKNEFLALIPIMRFLTITPTSYVPVFILASSCTTCSILIMLGNDSLTLLIMAHISHQFRHISERFTSYKGGKMEMKELVQNHCKILR